MACVAIKNEYHDGNENDNWQKRYYNSNNFLEKNCMRFLEIMRLLNQSIANSIASLGDNSTFKLTLFALLILTIELGVQEWIMRRFYTEECCQEYLI